MPGHSTTPNLRGHGIGALQNRLLAVTTINSTTTTESPTPRVDDSTFDLYVELEADDLATPEQLAVLEADRPGVARVPPAPARRRRRAPRRGPPAPGRGARPGRRRRRAPPPSAHRRAPPAHRRAAPGCARRPRRPGRPRPRPAAEPDVVEPGVVRLQLSWEPGRVVAWAGGPGCPAAGRRRGRQVPGRGRSPRRAVDRPPRRAGARRRQGRRGRGAGRRGPRVARRRRFRRRA